MERTILIWRAAFQSAVKPVVLAVFYGFRVGLSKWAVHGIVAIMASKRQIRTALLFLMAVVLVFPPLTSAVADSLGIELAHHHCESHTGDGFGLHADSDQDQSIDGAHTHGAAETDPFQCDQCHVALAALAVEADVTIRDAPETPTALSALMLVPVKTPPHFKPPIA